MASAFITTRPGPRYVVRYRLGGRAYPIAHGGSFGTLREARVRRDLIAGELAAGRNPDDALRTMTDRPKVQAVTVKTWRDRFLASRLDLDENTIKNYRSGLKRVCESFGEREPSTITATEVAEWVAALATKYKPGTVQLYLIAFRLLLDYVGLERTRRVIPASSCRSASGRNRNRPRASS